MKLSLLSAILTEGIGSCNRDKRRVCTKEEEGVSVVKRKERRSRWVHRRTIKKRIY